MSDKQMVKILDGGFSTQLSVHVGQKVDGDPLWTARFLATNPEAVLATHLDFLRAGSDFIQTNTYQASVGGFVKHLGISEEESLDLMRQAVNLTKKALKIYSAEIQGNEKIPNTDPLIVGSCGPYGAALNDASEYSGVYGQNVSPDIMAEWHRPRIEALVKAGVELLALETIPSKTEAEALVDLMRDFPNVKAWLSFSVRQDGKSIADGSDLREAAISCYDRALEGQLVAVGVNCLAPRLVTPSLKRINEGREDNPIPLVAYPNSGEQYSVSEGWKETDGCEPLEKYIPEWLDLGVRYIGGCCRTYAADVTKIREEVKKWESAKQN